jgi:DNA-binding LytR/AlgR family response regulator
MAARPTAVVVEDEAVLREALCAQLRRLWPELDIAAECETGDSALRFIERAAPDVLFLDIELPGISGLDVARAARGRCHIVFITAYDAHAVEAFEEGAVDYVLKPFDTERLALAVRRVEQRLGRPPPDLDQVLRRLASQDKTPFLRWLNGSDGSTVRFIAVDEVCYFQADTGYTRVVLPDGDALVHRSLRELQEALDPAMFWPVHRSTIVNARAIAAVSRDLRGRLTLVLKSRPEKLPVSDAHAHLFRQM